MKLSQILPFFPSDAAADIEARHAAFVAGRAEKRAGDATVELFLKHLHDDGTLPTETLRDILTLCDVTLTSLEEVLRESAVPQSRLQLLAILGQGSMGEIVMARDPLLGRTVALKRIDRRLLDRPSLVDRFYVEAQITAQLDHPNIVPILGLEEDATGRLSYAMKLVRGKTLGDYVDEAAKIAASGRAPDEDHRLKARIETFLPVLHALDYAHRRGILHRDLKPDNIMVGAFGEVLVMDWGIARPIGNRERVTEGPRVEKTRVGSLVGTPAYMSPEQASGYTEELTAASDQYALGLILFELVTLRRAIEGETGLEVAAKASSGHKAPLTPLSKKEPIARELAAIIQKATAREAGDRYASVAAFADDLRRFLHDEPVLADPDGPVRKVKRWIGHHRGLAMALGFGLVVAIALAVVGVRLAERSRAASREDALQRLVSATSEQAGNIDRKLGDYESLLQGVVDVANEYLQQPAPEDPGMTAYRYVGAVRDPAAAPTYGVPSRIYGVPSSLAHPDVTVAASESPTALRPRALQMWRLGEVLRRAQLASASYEALQLAAPEAEKLVLQEGAPLAWAYIGSADGVLVSMPATWTYEAAPGEPGGGYDHRRRAWYKAAEGAHGPRWNSSGVDESGLGLLITCSQALYDRDHRLLAVAAVDLTFSYVIDHLLENAVLVGAAAETLLIDQDGRVVVRSTQKEAARKAAVYDPKAFEEPALLEAAKGRQSGHIQLPDGRLALWSRLRAVDWLYVVVGSDERLLGATE